MNTFILKKDMLKIQRLNMDSSWKFQWNDTSFLIDPWLINSQIDYFKWFSEQWHIVAPMGTDNLGKYDAVSISTQNLRGKLPIELLFFETDSALDRNSSRYTATIFHLLRSYPNTLMKWNTVNEEA